MKVLFLNPEQYLPWQKEPSNYELRLPMLATGLIDQHEDFCYQRLLRQHGRKIMEQKLWEKVQQLAPDLITYSTTWDEHRISATTLKKIERSGVPIYAHVWDSHYRRIMELELLLHCSFVGIADSPKHFRAYQQALPGLYCKNVFFTAGHNVCPDLFRPNSSVDKIHQAYLMGSMEGARPQFLQRLQSIVSFPIFTAGGLVHGQRPFRPQFHEGFYPAKGWVDYENYVRHIQQSWICIVTQTVNNRQQIKGKIFEILACGGICLAENVEGMEELFPPGIIETFVTVEQCRDKLEHLLANKKLLFERGLNARRWWQENYGKLWPNFLANLKRPSAKKNFLRFYPYRFLLSSKKFHFHSKRFLARQKNRLKFFQNSGPGQSKHSLAQGQNSGHP